LEAFWAAKAGVGGLGAGDEGGGVTNDVAGFDGGAWASFVGGFGTVVKVISIAAVKEFHVWRSGPRYHELNQ